MANAVRDFAKSFQQYHLWAKLAWNDTLQRYRGSILGPFWIVLTTAAFAVGIGFVYAQLMGVPLRVYLPWIATGVVVWNLFAMAVQDGGDAFVSQGVIIRQSSTPLPVFIWRVILRHLINFAHQFVVLGAIAIYFQTQSDPTAHYLMRINLPIALAGVVLTVINVSWIVTALAILSARFRDLQQGVISLIQILFFLSPVIWIPGETRALEVLELNPVFHILEAVRNPLIGLPVPLHSLLYLVVMAAAGWAFAFLLYAGVRRRIVHYL